MSKNSIEACPFHCPSVRLSASQTYNFFHNLMRKLATLLQYLLDFCLLKKNYRTSFLRIIEKYNNSIGFPFYIIDFSSLFFH